jgi:hypothetical protein
MTVSTQANSLAQLLDAANANNITTLLQLLGLGRIVRQQTPATIRGGVPLVVAGYAYTPQTGVYTLQLPDDAKAAYILRAQVLVGSVEGELTFNAFGTTAPATTTCNVSASGDIVFNSGTDAPTAVDIIYVPERQDAYEIASISPASGVVTIPTALNGLSTVSGTGPANLVSRAALAVTLMEAEILTGTTTGKCVILKPSSSAPGSLNANLNLTKTQVLFHVADAPTSVRLKFGLTAVLDQNALLEAVSPVY